MHTSERIHEMLVTIRFKYLHSIQIAFGLEASMKSLPPLDSSTCIATRSLLNVTRRRPTLLLHALALMAPNQASNYGYMRQVCMYCLVHSCACWGQPYCWCTICYIRFCVHCLCACLPVHNSARVHLSSRLFLVLMWHAGMVYQGCLLFHHVCVVHLCIMSLCHADAVSGRKRRDLML